MAHPQLSTQLLRPLTTLRMSLFLSRFFSWSNFKIEWRHLKWESKSSLVTVKKKTLICWVGVLHKDLFPFET